MNNTIQPLWGNFLFLRGPYAQCHKQVDLWEHTSYLCPDRTEKSNSTESREPFQRSQNAKLYLRTKAAWVKPSQPTNLKSCHWSFVFIPVPAHTSLFSLSVVPSRSVLSSCKYDRATVRLSLRPLKPLLPAAIVFPNLNRKLWPLLLSDLIRASTRIHSASAKFFTAWGLCRLAGLGNKASKWKG